MQTAVIAFQERLVIDPRRCAKECLKQEKNVGLDGVGRAGLRVVLRGYQPTDLAKLLESKGSIECGQSHLYDNGNPLDL
jgi:hypothetical protein